MSEPAASEAVPQRHLVVRAVLRTDVGLVRSENQDFGTYTTASEESTSHPGGRLLIVADGMGGHRGGATASRLAGETVKAQYLDAETSDIATALHDSLARANARIYSEAQANPELRGMGTTTSVLAVRDRHGWLAHVGDSRIYLVRDGAIKQLTDDHSLVATMVREGLLTSAEAETHPRRNVLQRSMGVAEDVEIDVRGPFELREGDTFILCSDGLHGVVRENELMEIANRSIEEAADEFLRRALERGAPDNVTVIVARVEGTDEAPAVRAESLEDTQPLLDPNAMQYDETVKETQKLKAVTPEELRDTDKILAVAAAGDDTIPTGYIPRPQPAPPKKTPVLRWVLILALGAAAAGTWYFWQQQQAPSSNASPSPDASPAQH
jgi:serine/threonine protein phosphatase PrpC